VRLRLYTPAVHHNLLIVITGSQLRCTDGRGRSHSHKLWDDKMLTEEVQQLLTKVHKIMRRDNCNKTDLWEFFKVSEFSRECQTFAEWITGVLHGGKLTQMSFTAELQLQTQTQDTSQHVANYTCIIITQLSQRKTNYETVHCEWWFLLRSKQSTFHENLSIS